MKEATGELNLTVIVVLTVAGLVAFFSMVLWPIVKKNMTHDQKCSDAICKPCTTCGEGMASCHMKNDDTEFYCPYKG